VSPLFRLASRVPAPVLAVRERRAEPALYILPPLYSPDKSGGARTVQIVGKSRSLFFRTRWGEGNPGE
jgi:hypothetical protein